MNEIPKINVIPPRSKTEKFNKRYSKSVAGALPRTSSLVVKDAHGAIVRDIDDNEYIDFVGGFAVVSVGHCNPAVVDAVRNQVGKLIHISAHLGAYEPYLSLAEKIKSIAPGDLKRGKVLFGNSGTEAVEAALKLARYTTRKPSIIAFWPSFHGRTTAALSCTGVSASLKRYMPNVNVSFAPYPYCYRCPFKQEYPDCGLLCVDYFKTMLETTIPPENVAGLIAELISGEPGNIVPPSEFWSTIKKICEENGINTAVLRTDEHTIRILKKYWNERGGRIQWIAQTYPKEYDLTGNIKMAIDNGAIGAFMQGGIGDKFFKNGRVDLLGKVCLLYTSPSPRDLSTSRMPSSA